MGFGTNQMTSTTGTKFIPQVWSREMQRATEANLVAARLVKRFDRDVFMYGNTINVPKISNLTANSLGDNAAVSFQSPTEGSITITINQRYEASFAIQDDSEAFYAYQVAEEYKHKAAFALTKQVDTALLGQSASLTNTAAGTAGMAPTNENFLFAVQQLDVADVPAQDRAFIMYPTCKASLLTIDKFVNQDFTGLGDIPVKTGLFGQRYGVLFYMSTNVPLSGGYPLNQLIQKEAYCLALQKNITLKSQYDIQYCAQAYVSQILYGYTVYRANFGVVVNSN